MEWRDRSGRGRSHRMADTRVIAVEERVGGG